jgi:hypothetical protein
MEYSLHPLYEYMKEQGYNCVEITPDTCNDMKKALLELNAKDYIFITSAHTFLDGTYEYFQNSPVNLSVLEAIDILKPVKSVYYPHDLATLVHEFDVPWINSIFDIILFPFDGYAHLACNGKPVYNVGWIKKLNKTGSGTRFHVGHGIGDIYYYGKLGLDLYDTFQSVWEQGVIIKTGTPDLWEKQCAFFEQKNVKYIDPSKSIFELIDSCEIMLTNALTSVNLESSLSGRFTINMLDGIFERSEHEKYFKGLPNLKMMSIDGTAELLRDYYKGKYVPPQGEDVLKEFNFKLAVELITA